MHNYSLSNDFLMYGYSGASPFPPSFEGNPWSYGFGLFGDVVAAAIALAILLAYLIEGRRFRQISKLVNNQATLPDHMDRWSPLWFYVTGQKCFLSFVVMRTLPDSIWMLAWGEVRQPTIEAMLTADMIFDGLSILPLLLASLCWAWSRQVIPQMLTENARLAMSGKVPWDVVTKNLKIVGVVSFIALLVTVGKASA